jgi:hypothetical protein
MRIDTPARRNIDRLTVEQVRDLIPAEGGSRRPPGIWMNGKIDCCVVVVEPDLQFIHGRTGDASHGVYLGDLGTGRYSPEMALHVGLRPVKGIVETPGVLHW